MRISSLGCRHLYHPQGQLMPMYAIVDCNNFYVSCERVFKPKWIGKPVVVLSNNDGCVIARSQESKALGIEMGALPFQNKDLFKKHGVIVCSSNYTLYGDMSFRVMEALRQFTPDMEVYSIDEAFLHLEERFATPDYAVNIQKTVLQWTGIPVSVGIAPTKTLAKVANRIAKKNPSMKGVSILENKNQIEAVLQKLPVEDIWGIGRNISAFLNSEGIYTAWEFCQTDDTWIKKNLSVVALRTALELRGTPCLELQEIPPSKKAILSSRSFGRPVVALEDLEEALSAYTARAAEKLRRQGSLASFLEVYIETNVHKGGPYYSDKAHVTLPQPTAYTPDLTSYAKQALLKIFCPGLKYKKVGIMLGALVPADSFQQDLFANRPEDQAKQKILMQLMDKANKNSGRKILRMASEGIEQSWQMRRANCSPHFTTQWGDLLRIP